MTGFTKGPWHIADLGAVDDANIVDANGNEVLGTSEWLRLSDADAHLIAAAPSLYEALEAACDAYDDACNFDMLTAQLDQAIDAARTALAKARGETK